MGKMLVIRRNMEKAAAWCRKYGFSHRYVGDELRIYGLADPRKASWLDKFKRETGAS